MKKILIILLLLPILAMSQEKDEKEEFVNQVFKYFVDSTFQKYYLESKCNSLSIDIADSIQITKYFEEYVPTEILGQLIKGARNEPSQSYWNTDKLSDFICVSEDSLNKMIRKPFIVETKWFWRKERKRVESLKQIQKQMNDPKVLQSRTVYRFSQPVYSNDCKYALIRMGFICGGECGENCLLLFEKLGDKWKYINRTSCIIF